MKKKSFIEMLTGGGEVAEDVVEVNETDANQMKFYILEPRAPSEKREVINHLLNGQIIAVSLSRLGPDKAMRVFDYIDGAVYAIGGNIRQLPDGVIICTPKAIPVEGTLKPTDNEEIEIIEEDE